MVVDTSEFITLSEWIGGALQQFLVATLILVLAGIFIGYLYSLFRYGPVEAVYIVAAVVFNALFVDLSLIHI